MKRRNLVIAIIAFAAVTAAIGSAVASLLPVLTPVYVRVDEGSPGTGTNLKYVGDFDLTIGTQVDILVNVFDTRVNTTVQRKARTSADAIIKAPTATTISTPVTIP